MIKQVIVTCVDCEHRNPQELGMPGFELLQTDFESFSEAWDHKLQNPSHYLTMQILENEKE